MAYWDIRVRIRDGTCPIDCQYDARLTERMIFLPVRSNHALRSVFEAGA